MAAMRKGQASTPIGPSRNANDIPLPGETLPLAGLPVHPLPDYRTDGAAAVVAPSGPVEVEED
jgi:hypothetical protein